MNSGHSSPSSNERIVPVTTPIANSAIIAFDQRRESASSSAAAAEPLHPQNERRERDAEAHERDVHRERQRLHLPRLEQVLLLHGTEHLRELHQHRQVLAREGHYLPANPPEATATPYRGQA